MTEAQLAEIWKVEQEAGAAQNTLQGLVEALEPLGNAVLTESLQHALMHAQKKGWEAQEQLEEADALPE